MLGWLVLLCASSLVSRVWADAEPCSQDVIDQALGRAPCTLCRESPYRDDRGLPIRCNLTLEAGSTVVHPLLYLGAQASHTTLTCDGAEGERAVLARGLTVKSALLGMAADGFPIASRPTNIKVIGCTIEGSVHVRGEPDNGASGAENRSSQLPGHVERMRAWAPADVTLDHVLIRAERGVPLYVFPGVTGFVLRHSRISGQIESSPKEAGVVPPLVYLDSESTGAILQNNVFDVTPRHPHLVRRYRELLAIDAADRNRVVGNVFHTLGHGGIFLYRNCGERGRARWVAPTHNEIVNNTFIEPAERDRPTIWIGSRSARPASYCGEDRGFPYGSAVDDRDFARFNVVAHNRVRTPAGESVAALVEGGRLGDSVDSPNYIFQNQAVSELMERASGCWLWTGFHTQFLDHGANSQALLPGVEASAPRCTWLRCNDGLLEESGHCTARVVPLDCRARDGAHACQKAASCPAGMQILGASVSCDLADERAPAAVPALPEPGQLEVLSTRAKGWCYAGSASASAGSAAIHGPQGASTLRFGCLRSGQSAESCRVTGALYCAAPDSGAPSTAQP